MQAPAENSPEKSKLSAGMSSPFAQLLWRRLVEFWILLAIVTFLVLRVLGSHTVGRFLSGIAHRHPS
jgi:hypothetical protein